MKDRCDKIRDKLSAYLDGELRPDEMAEVAAHLETCPECSALLDRMRRIDEMAGSSIPDFDNELMDNLADRIMEGIDESEQVSGDAGPKPRVIPIWYKYIAVAASIVIIFLAGRMAFKESGGNLLGPSTRRELMKPAAKDTTMPYLESESAADMVQKAKPQSMASPPQAPVDEHEAASPTMEENAADRYGKQKAPAKTEELPAPATIESPPSVKDQTAGANLQVQTEAARKKPSTVPAEKPASPGKISGRIVDAKTGEPLYGVTVQLEGTTMGAKSNLDGDFSILSVPPDTYNLTYSSPGYEAMQYSEVPVYAGKTEELTVAMNPSVLETGNVTEVRGTRKSIDFLETGTVTKKAGETIAVAEQTVAATTALPDVDSLEAQYASVMNEYWEKGAGKSRAILKSAKAEPRLADVLQKVIDSLNTELDKEENPAERLDVSYLRLRAAIDLYNETGKADDKSKLEGYEEDFEGELSVLQKQGYDSKTLDAYRSRIKQMKRRK